MSARWAPGLPPKGTVMDEFGRVWRVAHMQEWSSGKRQFTVEPSDHFARRSPDTSKLSAQPRSVARTAPDIEGRDV